jgi:hypothetical protein
VSDALLPQDSPDHPMAAWFADARRERAAAIAARPEPDRPRTRAIITMVHNEPVFLPIWLAYYGRYFAPEDIYVLDNDTTDGSTDRDGFVRIPVTHETVDHPWMVRTVEELQHELIGRYDVTVVTDVDEIISPVPEWGDLGEYLDVFSEPWVNCLGYELLHMRDLEPPLDLSRPVLDQRRHWFVNGAYDKAAIAAEPMSWRTGFHGRSDFHYKLDPDLRLIHLHRMDFELCRARHAVRSRKAWAAEDERRGWAGHNRIVEEDPFARWFYEDSCVEGLPVRPEEMRASWRGRF